MSFISRSASRLITFPKQCLSKPLGSGMFAQSQCSVRPLTRSLVVLSTPSKINPSKPSNLCSCGCGIHGMHTQGDKELSDFLKEEIDSEKKSQASSIPSRLDEFTIKKDKAELTLTKSFNDETISISLNVNHTVESDNVPANPESESNEATPLSSKPDFEVDVKVGSKTLSFTCQFGSQQSYIDDGDVVTEPFGISELTVFEGESEEKVYCASGDILDGVMYDLLLNYLEERGITVAFTEKLSALCTDYEHSLYVDMLENIQNFIKRK